MTELASTLTPAKPQHDTRVSLRARLARLRANYLPILIPSTLSMPVKQQRMKIMQSRINAIAWILVFAVPLWGIMDAIAFPEHIWRTVFTSRLFASAAFICFLLIAKSLQRKGSGTIEFIYAQLTFILAVPTLFYFFCRLPPATQTDPFVAAIIFSYSFLPFAVLTILGLFPLTIMESAAFSASLLFLYTAENFYASGLPSPVSGIGILWVMALVAGLIMLTSVSQLRLLIALVNYSAYDILTQCLSRRSGNEIMRTVWSYSIRHSAKLAIALIDLDFFKSVNDNHGHPAGDLLLTQTAAAIKGNLRDSDFVIRWGGEEFLIIMANTDADAATLVVKRLMKMGFGSRPDGEAQTVSIGIAERAADQAESFATLIELADNRLYQAKSTGRNRFVGVSQKTG